MIKKTQIPCTTGSTCVVSQPDPQKQETSKNVNLRFIVIIESNKQRHDRAKGKLNTGTQLFIPEETISAHPDAAACGLIRPCKKLYW